MCLAGDLEQLESITGLGRSAVVGGEGAEVLNS